VDLIREKARIPELEYIFKHTMTQEAAYNSLLHERRREFHLKVGEALEQLFTDRTEEFLGLLAHHFEVAESMEKAVDYLIRAGDKARLEDALEEATGYYHRALKLIVDMEDEERASQTWLKLGLISMANFDFDGAHRANEAAFALEQKTKSRRGIGVELDQQPEEPPRNLSIVITGQSGNLDPGKALWVLESQFMSQIFAGLTELDSEMNVVPHVARSWEVLDGGKRYLFHLRDDVYWTDGSPVTAKDFEWAWIRNVTFSTEAFMAFMLDDVVGAHDYRTGRNTDPRSVGVRALDLTTLEVRLNTPVAYFIYLMTHGVTYPLPRAVIERYGEEWWKPEHIISNGAFQLTRYEDEHITLERNPDYFAQFPGNLDRIELFDKLEAEVRVEEYVKGTVDVAVYIPSRLVPEDTSHDEIHSHNFSLTLFYLVFNPHRAPLNDVRIRRALAHALDRRRILEVAIGHGTPPASGIIPAGMPGHSPELGLGLDVSTAQRYLAEAGYPDGKDFPRVNIICNPTSFNLQIIPEIVRQWGEWLGIEVVFDEVPVGKSMPRSKSSEFHGRLQGWAADYPDPDSFLRHSNIYHFLQNWGWEDEQYKELVELAARTPNRSRRMAMYRQADHMLVADDALVVPIWYGGSWSLPHLMKPWVKNYRLNALGHIRFKDVTLEHRSRLTE
jgi:oligopeptide transport system substrate-binding protein